MIRRAQAGAAIAVLLLSGCAAPAQPTASSSHTLTVFAAASLKSTFTELAKKFEGSHPGTTVQVSFAGSQALVDQLDQGATADVLATADEATMAKAVTSGVVAGDPVPFVSNQLTIAVPPSNPAGVASFADLTRPGLKLVICAPKVPCGAATAKVAAATGTKLTPVSEELAVTDVLAKVQAGEADAGLVYATDAKAAGNTVAAVAFPEAAQAINRYPIAALAKAPEAALAKDFVSYVTGPDARQTFEQAGFAAP